MGFSEEAKQVAGGIKKQEQDEIKYNISIFFSLLAGIGAFVIAWMFIPNLTFSAIVGVITTLGLGVCAANNYFKG